MGNTHSEKLYNYCQRGDNVKVGHLLEYQNCNINWRNPGKHYRSPLIIASKRGHVEVVRLLLSKKANTTIRDWFGWNALDYASYRGHFDIVNLLTEDLNWVRNGKTAYYNESSLHIAVRTRQLPIVELLLKKGGGEIANDTSIKRNTALHYAVARRDMKLIKLLLPYSGPSLRYRNMDKHTPYEMANSMNFPEAMELITDSSKGTVGERKTVTSSTSLEIIEERQHNEDDQAIDDNTDDSTELGMSVQCSVKCILSGPPLVGKSTFRKRITGDYVTAAGHSLEESTKKERKISSFSKPSQSVVVMLEKITRLRTQIGSSSSEDEQDSDPDEECQNYAVHPNDLEGAVESTYLESKHGSVNSLDKINQNSCSLNIIDTNSLPEFHEILPLILEGPGLHLVFFDASVDLNKEIHIKDESGYETRYTQIQILHTLLSSYYDKKSKYSKVILLATHVDKITGDLERTLKHIDNELRNYFANSDFITKDFLVPDPSTHHLFTTVDNVNEGEEELKQIIAHFQEIIDKNFPLIEIPYRWASFQYTLQQRYKSIGLCKYSDCLKIAKECGIGEDDVPKVLQFLHHDTGTILYYGEIESLNEFVICNPDYLFSSIKEVIFAASRNGFIRKTGEVPAHLIANSDPQRYTLLIEEWRIYDLLKHYNILLGMSPIRDSYFVSSLLLPDTSLIRVSQEEIDRCPLLIQFKGAFIPVGIFSALVVKLAQKWTLKEDNRYSNRVSFLTQEGTEVVLLSRMSYLEVQINTDFPRLRLAVYNTMEDAILQSFSVTKFTFSFGFYCPNTSSSASLSHIPSSHSVPPFHSFPVSPSHASPPSSSVSSFHTSLPSFFPPPPHFSHLRRSTNEEMVCQSFSKCFNYRRKINLSHQHKAWLQQSPVQKDSGKAVIKKSQTVPKTSQIFEVQELRKQLIHKEEELEESRIELDAMTVAKDLRISQLEELISDQNRQIKTLQEEKNEKLLEETQRRKTSLLDHRYRLLLKQVRNEISSEVKKKVFIPIKKTVTDARIGLILSILVVILISFTFDSRKTNLTSIPLPGVEVLATKRLTVVGGQASLLHWDEFGLRLDIPANALPPRTVADIVIHVSSSGPYLYPDFKSWKLASAIYWIMSSKNFVNPVLLGLWHNVREFSNSSKLRFITSSQDSIDNKYEFHPVKTGFFLNQESFGYLSTHHFSGFGVQSMKDIGDKFVGNLLQKPTKTGSQRDYSFIVYEEVPNGMSQKLINDAGYKGWFMFPPVIVEFETDFIMLNLSSNGGSDNKGWTATATFPPAEIHKEDVANGNIISNMQFFVTWRGKVKPVRETLSLNLLGSKRPKAVNIPIIDLGPVEPCHGETVIPITDIPRTLVLHLDEINEIMQLCIYLGLKWHQCDEIKQTNLRLNEQKIILVQKWYDTSPCTTWKVFIRALVSLQKCRKAKELAANYQVYFDENDEEFETIAKSCPSMSQNHEL